MYKVVHLSYSSNGGGAAIACRRMHETMVSSGIDSCIVTNKQISPVPHNASRIWYLWFRFFHRMYWRRVQSETSQYVSRGTWSGAYSLNLLDTNKSIQEADIIYLHWINFNMVSIEEIGKLLDTGKPVIWFLHDMWPLTGGCHHAFECKKYQTHCTSCPMLTPNGKHDLSYSIHERKIKCIKNRCNLTIVAPSHWLAECAHNSCLFQDNRIEIIPNIIDISVFYPVRKAIAREALGLPLDKKIILFGCDAGSKNFYKGWNYMVEALQQLHSDDVELVLFGSNEQDSLKNEFTQKVHLLGRLNDDFSLRLAYSAVDVFVSPTIAEAFGMTLAEAESCGTPAVCFDIGGTRDVVLHKNTGYLAKYKDSYDLAKGIEWILKSEHYDELSKNAREHIASFCAPTIVLEQHKKLINSMLSIKETRKL